MFKCKACPEKDARIHELKQQIEFLKKLAYPQSTIAPLIDLEANKVLDGAGVEQVILNDEAVKANEALEKEFMSIITGNY